MLEGIGVSLDHLFDAAGHVSADLRDDVVQELALGLLERKFDAGELRREASRAARRTVKATQDRTARSLDEVIRGTDRLTLHEIVASVRGVPIYGHQTSQHERQVGTCSWCAAAKAVSRRLCRLCYERLWRARRAASRKWEHAPLFDDAMEEADFPAWLRYVVLRLVVDSRVTNPAPMRRQPRETRGWTRRGTACVWCGADNVLARRLCGRCYYLAARRLPGGRYDNDKRRAREYEARRRADHSWQRVTVQSGDGRRVRRWVRVDGVLNSLAC